MRIEELLSWLQAQDPMAEVVMLHEEDGALPIKGVLVSKGRVALVEDVQEKCDICGTPYREKRPNHNGWALIGGALHCPSCHTKAGVRRSGLRDFNG